MIKLFLAATSMAFLIAATASQACTELPPDMPIVASVKHEPSIRSASPSISSREENAEMEFIHVPGGCYCMGDVQQATSRDAAPVHQACVDDYYMGKYAVTLAQWRDIMGTSPSAMNNCGDNCPVVDVSWYEVQEFIRRLGARSGKMYRLPTEAEWEYAARSSGMQETSGSGDSVRSARALRPAGSSRPNEFGIYDMQGGVWEWTADWYGPHYYRQSPTNNPEGPSNGDSRVLRGSSWIDVPESLQATRRIRYAPWIKRPWVGFRLLYSDPDMQTARYGHSDMHAQKEGGNLGLQCTLTQDALYR